VGALEVLGLRRSSVVSAVIDGQVVEAALVGGGDVAQAEHLPPAVAASFGIPIASARVTRAQACSIPAVSRGREIIVGTVSGLPLMAVRQPVANDGQNVAATGVQRVRRSLLEQPERTTHRQVTIAWTIDDLLFHGIAWWRVTSRDAAGFPTFVERLELARVTIDYAERRVLVDGTPARDADLIRFDGPHEGLLRRAAAMGGADPLYLALRLEQAAGRYADQDVPTGLLYDKRAPGAGDLKDEEVDTLLGRWMRSRRSRSTGWLGRTLGYQAVAHNAEQMQLVESRQHEATEIARLLNLEAEELSAQGAGGLTYSNTEALRRGRVDRLAPYLGSITGRLSMGDVTPRGQAVQFDTAGYIRGDEAQVIDTAVKATSGTNPLMSVDEARARWLDLGPRPADAQPAPAPAPTEEDDAA